MRRMNQSEPAEYQENENISAEARLFAEILNRMDEQSMSKQRSAMNVADVEQDTTIDFEEMFYFLLSKLHYILLGMIMGGILLGIYAFGFMDPIYAATSKLYLMGQTGVSIMSDLQIGSQLTMDYQEVFKTWEVHEMVIEELGLGFSYSEMQKKLTVSNPSDTRVLYITIRDTDAKRAADIANAYAKVGKKFIIETMDTNEPSTFSIALVPSIPESKSTTSYIIMGAVLGTVLAVCILVLCFILDNRPKSAEDIMRSANIPTLAIIPNHPELSGDTARQRRQRERSRS